MISPKALMLLLLPSLALSAPADLEAQQGVRMISVLTILLLYVTLVVQSSFVPLATAMISADLYNRQDGSATMAESSQSNRVTLNGFLTSHHCPTAKQQPAIHTGSRTDTTQMYRVLES
jgi:hypothetical protein